MSTVFLWNRCHGMSAAAISARSSSMIRCLAGFVIYLSRRADSGPVALVSCGFFLRLVVCCLPYNLELRGKDQDRDRSKKIASSQSQFFPDFRQYDIEGCDK